MFYNRVFGKGMVKAIVVGIVGVLGAYAIIVVIGRLWL